MGEVDHDATEGMPSVAVLCYIVDWLRSNQVPEYTIYDDLERLFHEYSFNEERLLVARLTTNAVLEHVACVIEELANEFKRLLEEAEAKEE